MKKNIYVQKSCNDRNALLIFCFFEYDIPTGWDFHKSFQMNNELKLVTKPCIYQEIENITKEEEKVNSLLSVNKS